MAQKDDPKPDQKQDARSNRPKARLPRGLADRGPAEIAATRAMLETIRKVYELYGFEPVETPAFEYTDALGKFLPDQDRPNEGVFSFQDDDEQWLSLRYDLTAPLARYVAENFDHLPKPYRSYRAGWVFRNEKPGPGRFRQFMQFDADTVGSASMAADAEICMMAADTMEALGITSRSRNGVRSSRPCAMAIRSALTRMSPGSQVLMSISCMVATSSRRRWPPAGTPGRSRRTHCRAPAGPAGSPRHRGTHRRCRCTAAAAAWRSG